MVLAPAVLLGQRGKLETGKTDFDKAKTDKQILSAEHLQWWTNLWGRD